MRSTISSRYVIFLLPLLLLFLLFSILTADPGTEKREFEELPEPAELSSLTVLSPTQDTILYDNNTAAYLDTTLDAWTGVRFTPLYNFELQAIYFAILNQYNNTTDGCSLYVVADDGAGFDPEQLPDPTAPGFLERPCGRGIMLMRTFMDEVRFNDIGNQVTLVKRRAVHTGEEASSEGE